MQIDFKTLGDYADVRSFLAERTKIISSCNEEIAELHNKVRAKLFIMPENSCSEIALYRTPLKAIVFHDEDDRKGKIKGTFVNFGEYHIDTIEVYYGEHIRSGATHAVNWIKINLRGTQPGRTVPNFCKTCDFGGFDDEKLSWGRNCFFLDKNEYLLFKETVADLKEKFAIS